jgi:uncharacterized membrane protein SpoIIM required for sporulation
VRRDEFIASRTARWNELDDLVSRAKRRPERLGAEGVLRLGDCYRATAADLALARRRFPGDPIVEQLTSLVGRARPVVYERDRKRESFVVFATTGFWQRVRERPVFLVIATVLLFGAWTLAAIWAHRDPAAASGVVPEMFQDWTEPSLSGDRAPTAEESAAFSSALFTNNIRVAFIAFAGGVTAGLGTALSLLYNGLVVGAVTGLAIDAGNGRVLLEWIPAHGLLEMTCFVVAGAAGMRMGWAIVAPGNRTRGVAFVAEARPATEMALGAAAWLVVAGLIEGFVSPSGVGLAERIVVGVGAAGAFWALVIWRGKQTADQ